MERVIVSNISKSYRNGNGESFKVVDGVDFTISPGEIFAFLGVNGAGKTSTIKMISGLTLPDSGSITIYGKDPSQSSSQHLLGAILEGNRNLYWRLSALENLIYYGVLKGLSIKQAKARGMHLLEQFNFLEHKKLLVQYMSRGMQQKLAILVALVHSPKVLILDEPTLGLDVATRDTFSTIVKEIARNFQVCVLLTSHDLEFVGRTASSYSIIQKGKIVRKGKLDELNGLMDSSGYRVRLGNDFDKNIDECLHGYSGIIVKEENNSFVVPREHLYEILERLKPANILQVSALTNDLEQLLLNPGVGTV